jgi:O-antigen ligase
MMAVNALLAYRLDSGKWWNPDFFNLFILGLFLYFTMQAVALLYTWNLSEGIAIFKTNLGMIVLPVGIQYSNLVNRQSFRRWMRGYLYILISATVLALVYASIVFYQDHNAKVFFYHPLVSLYSNHAVQFSVIVFIGLLFLIEEYGRKRYLKSRILILMLIIYFSVFLFLLSSKLVITIYFLYILYLIGFTKIFIAGRVHRIVGLFILLAMMIAAFIFNTPFSERIRKEANARLSVVRQEQFNPGDYFTGVQFRILSWRFVYEILNEKHAWIWGVSPGDSQDALAEKYTRENMFTGGTPENKMGYLGYHSHNQFLQAILETGLFGLAFFIIACGGLIRMAGKSAGGFLWVLVFLLLCNCFTDAPLKTQYGIILFVFFPLFMYKGTQKGAPED